jgi:hypothetical protein
MNHFSSTRMIAIGVMSLAVAGRTTTVEAHVGGVAPGVIHSCVATKNGALRIIGATDSCKMGETPVDWNAVGPQGPIGLTGPL